MSNTDPAKLYVKFAEKEKPKTIREFLVKFYSTKYSNFLKAELTYLDKKCTRLQHEYPRYRSFDDLADLIRTYFPNATDKRVMVFLMKTKILLSNGVVSEPHLGICGGMQRIRFIPYHGYTPLPEYFDLKPAQSKYSWKDLFEMIGVHNENEFKEYIKNKK